MFPSAPSVCCCPQTHTTFRRLQWCFPQRWNPTTHDKCQTSEIPATVRLLVVLLSPAICTGTHGKLKKSVSKSCLKSECRPSLSHYSFTPHLMEVNYCWSHSCNCGDWSEAASHQHTLHSHRLGSWSVLPRGTRLNIQSFNHETNHLFSLIFIF